MAFRVDYWYNIQESQHEWSIIDFKTKKVAYYFIHENDLEVNEITSMLKGFISAVEGGMSKDGIEGKDDGLE